MRDNVASENIANAGFSESAVTPERRAALEAAAYNWLGDNWAALEWGGMGDAVQLFAALSAAWTKAPYSPAGCPNADHNSSLA